MYKTIILVITMCVLSGITGVGGLIICPYEGTWMQQLWNKARNERRMEMQKGREIK